MVFIKPIRWIEIIGQMLCQNQRNVFISIGNVFKTTRSFEWKFSFPSFSIWPDRFSSLFPFLLLNSYSDEICWIDFIDGHIKAAPCTYIDRLMDAILSGWQFT